MEADAIKDVLVDLGMRRSDLKIIHGWVSTKCPLARYTHQKGSDSAASAGVSIKAEPVFNCFTCGNAKPFHAMVAQYAEYTGEDFSDLVSELEEQAYLGPATMPDWDTTKQVDQENVLMPLNEAVYMDLYDSAAGHPYLESRGISAATATKLELLFDPEDRVDREKGIKGVGRILFPVRGPDGELYGFSGRDVTGKSLVKARDYAGLKKALCVLGSHLITSEAPRYVLAAEGLFDYANGWEQGQPTVALMHSGMTPAQADIFRGFGLPVYMFHDDDDAGRKGVAEATEALIEYTPILRVRYPEIWIENPDEDEGGHYVKDPGELLAEDFDWMINDAQIIVPARRRTIRKHY